MKREKVLLLFFLTLIFLSGCPGAADVNPALAPATLVYMIADNV